MNASTKFTTVKVVKNETIMDKYETITSYQFDKYLLKEANVEKEDKEVLKWLKTGWVSSEAEEYV
jgi:hypothetical protein